MTSKINDELLKQMKESEQKNLKQELPVIVSFTSNANLSALKQKGLKIKHIFENISALSGTMTAEEIKELALLDEVECIEYDGTVTAL
ncbi:MAG: hypothetical protein GY928_26215 [Colwellia sp.]|nr:hypothetical protein [Colwellia sp.]